ncbi:MAG TPA: radical SAM protein, partial [bacterium]|nr:radical SAM protein [bacterium]
MKTNPSEKFRKNRELNRREIMERRTALSSLPVSLICALTNRCNTRCIMCSTWKEPWELPQKTYREVFSLLPYLEHVIWLGGEVFLYPDFGRLLDETGKYPWMKQRINTSGLMITEEWAELLVRNNVELIYSIDAAVPETYEHIRQGGRYEDLIRSLERVCSMREKHNREFELFMNVVVMKSNYRELAAVLDLAKKYGFKQVQFMPIQGCGTEEHIFSGDGKNIGMLEDIEKTMQVLERKAGDYGIVLQNSLPSPKIKNGSNTCLSPVPKQKPGCYLPWQQILIYPDGNVRFGCFCEDPVGNVLEDSINDIWNSPKAG